MTPADASLKKPIKKIRNYSKIDLEKEKSNSGEGDLIKSGKNGPVFC